MKELMHIGFIGNPNCGKTTLFNAYTGAKLKVANWPGVTVEKKEGIYCYNNYRLRLADLPGIYSLTSYTLEERLSREYILDNDVDVIIDVVDASNLERNLYLTLQLIELGEPVILALNMMDIVEERGMQINTKELSNRLGIPVIPVSARKKTGLAELMQAAIFTHKTVSMQAALHSKTNSLIMYSKDMETKIRKITSLLRAKYPAVKNLRWCAIKLLEQDGDILKQYPMNLKGLADKSYESAIINQKYDFIEKIVEETVKNKNKKVESTDIADKLLTNRYLGMPVFLFIMALIFFLTFTYGDLLKGVFEATINNFSNGVYVVLVKAGVSTITISLVVDGIISGVGTILTFLPNIFILFLSLAFLEDSGYMSRVAYVMDGLMSHIGLSGKAFIPLLLGFGCSVPAVMSSRTLEDMGDRRRTVMMIPFMSCSAKIPIYVLFSGMFFGKYAFLAAFSMYLIGLAAGILYAYIVHRIDSNKGSGQDSHILLIELPEYKTPNGRTILIYVWGKVKDYLTKAGTTIFLASVIIWFLLNFNMQGLAKDMSESFGAITGRILVPVLKPAGLGLWQVGVALISGIAAKEVVVSSFSVLFGIGNINTMTGMQNLVEILKPLGFGRLNAYAFMIFCLFYTPCAAAMGVIARELKSAKWTLFVMVSQFLIAWAAAVVVFQIGRLLM